SFHGAASPPFPEPIVIDRVQNDARLRCDYPRPVDPSFLPNISFRMAWNNGSDGNIIVQNYTLAGPQNGDRLFQGYQVVPDGVGRYYYGAEQHHVWRIDSQNGAFQEMVVPPELPEVS